MGSASAGKPTSPVTGATAPGSAPSAPDARNRPTATRIASMYGSTVPATPSPPRAPAMNKSYTEMRRAKPASAIAAISAGRSHDESRDFAVAKLGSARNANTAATASAPANAARSPARSGGAGAPGLAMRSGVSSAAKSALGAAAGPGSAARSAAKIGSRSSSFAAAMPARVAHRLAISDGTMMPAGFAGPRLARGAAAPSGGN